MSGVHAVVLNASFIYIVQASSKEHIYTKWKKMCRKKFAVVKCIYEYQKSLQAKHLSIPHPV